MDLTTKIFLTSVFLAIVDIITIKYIDKNGWVTSVQVLALLVFIFFAIISVLIKIWTA